MLTSRNRGVALHAKADSIPHDLRFLSEEESWDLLQEKVFQGEICPPELMEVGKEIARKCRGLPLTIVVVAGLLAKTEKTLYWWEEVMVTMRSHIASDPYQDMKTLDYSYHHLPDHLRPCFLYFGAYREDYKITVKKLTQLWMAEGFVVKSDGQKLEDVAENYLMDLIERSLILVVKRRSNGRVKSCRIHDVLHDLCLKKVEEENFMRQIVGYEEVSSLTSNYHFMYSYETEVRARQVVARKTLYPDYLHELWAYCNHRWLFNMSFLIQKYNLLKVLDLLHVVFDSYPSEIEQFEHLTYLAMRARFNSIPPSISNLRKLETLIVKGVRGYIIVDFDLGEMVKLRHLDINPLITLQLGGSLILPDLQTISTPGFHSWNQSYSESTPNLQKLRCFIYDRNILPIIGGLEFLLKLETLTMFHYGKRKDITLFDLPTSLKKVTLVKFQLGWAEISKLARLPNLEVLKLLHNAFEGHLWDTSSMECDFQTFPKLKFLKFESLDIMEWNASKDDFPSLQRLVLNKCEQLKEIPTEIGEIPTLETMELNWSSSTAVESARQILQEQRDMGNEQLEILVYPPNSNLSNGE